MPAPRVPAELRQKALAAAAALRKASAGLGPGQVVGLHVAGPTRGRSVVAVEALAGLPELLEALAAAATEDPALLAALRESVGLSPRPESSAVPVTGAQPSLNRFRKLELD